jgi:uncharacterized membrane protein
MFEFAAWVGTTPLSVSIQSSTWLMPLLQAIHILMIGIVFVSVLVLVLRLQGRAYLEEPFNQIWRRFAPWLWAALAVMAASGLLLIIGEPSRQARALSFWLKMLMIIVSVLALLRLCRAATGLAAASLPAANVRRAARLVLLLWVVVIFLGRAIAYDAEVWGRWSLGVYG